jgi:hypothetical protein
MKNDAISKMDDVAFQDDPHNKPKSHNHQHHQHQHQHQNQHQNQHQHSKRSNNDWKK